MSSHYLYITCANCKKSEPIYTGDKEAEYFDDADWEGELVEVDKCRECKEKDDE